jgi:hypothetical protein
MKTHRFFRGASAVLYLAGILGGVSGCRPNPEKSRVTTLRPAPAVAASAGETAATYEVAEPTKLSGESP